MKLALRLLIVLAAAVVATLCGLDGDLVVGGMALLGGLLALHP
jgi:hypothetical protein